MHNHAPAVQCPQCGQDTEDENAETLNGGAGSDRLYGGAGGCGRRGMTGKRRSGLNVDTASGEEAVRKTNTKLRIKRGQKEIG